MASKEPQYREWVNTDGVKVKIRTDVVRRPIGRLDSPFRSPVDGTVITTQKALWEHNVRNGVQQWEPGMDSEVKEKAKERERVLSGEADSFERKMAVKRAIEKLERQA